MKRMLVLLLAVLLLAGCVQNPPPTEPVETTLPTETEKPLGPALYEQGSSLEQATGGTVRAYPLESPCDGVLLMGERVLLYFSGEQTLLNAYAGEDLRLEATVSRYPQIPADGNLMVTENGLSYYSQATGTLVVLDENLREVRKLDLPDDILGIPVVDREMKNAYYATQDGIRVLDLGTGIGHMLRQQPSGNSVMSGGCFDGTLLVTVTTGEDGAVTTSFIQAADGLQVGKDDTLDEVESFEDLYFLRRGTGGIPVYLFGTGEELRLFAPASPAAQVFTALSLGAVVTAQEGESGTVLDYYDLASGLRTASVPLEGITGVRDVTADPAGFIWFLNDQNILCRWDVSQSGTDDEMVYTSPWHSEQDPNADGLARCESEAEALEQKYGVSLRIWRDAISAPWEALTAESRVDVYEHMLAVADETLALFPEGFLAQLGTISDNGLITISLVADAGPQGVQQTWQEGNAHMAVEPGEDMETELLRGIYRIMDTYVLGENSILDDWDADKPAEARARLFVEAMEPDNAGYFDGYKVQQKLRTLCRAIRDAFGLKKYENLLPWEQYLDDPLH